MECTIPSFPRIAAETPLGEPWTGNFKLQKQEVIKTPVAVTARRSAFASLKIRRVLQEASVPVLGKCSKCFGLYLMAPNAAKQQCLWSISAVG